MANSFAHQGLKLHTNHMVAEVTLISAVELLKTAPNESQWKKIATLFGPMYPSCQLCRA